MNRSKPLQTSALRYHRQRGPLLAGLFVITALSAQVAFAAAGGYQPVRTSGGLNSRPVITSMVASNNQVTVKWSGFGGPYRVDRCPVAAKGDWENLGNAAGTSFTFDMKDKAGIIRILSPSPDYAGSETCSQCHTNRHATWTATRHAGAFETLRAIKQETNAACLPCHTVGYGLPSGFVDEATTPKFEGVQCENCHGPAANHAKNPSDLSIRPVKTLSANLCGGCHTDDHHPTFENWELSKHAEVEPEVASSMVSQGQTRMASCGACHSGAVRLAMLTAAQTGKAVVYPSGQEAAEIGVTCAVCHDPHEKTVNQAQLRNPTYSKQPFSYSTAATNSFAAQYDPTVAICGQCHNARGATWKDTSRSPHHSQQYAIFSGTGGYVPTGVTAKSSPHTGMVTNGCSQCHMARKEVAAPTPEDPVYTGHTFNPRLNGCIECHDDEATAASKITTTQTDIKNRIAVVKALLDQWAATSADPGLAKYGPYAWEYNNVGDVTDPTGTVGAKGPVTADQALIPDEIKQARFNLYTVAHDQSYGVHNGRYSRDLLNAATNLVNLKLVKP